jgi:hypothetical protein
MMYLLHFPIQNLVLVYPTVKGALFTKAYMNQHLTICTTGSTGNARTRINSFRPRKLLMPVGSRVLTNESSNLLLPVQAVIYLGSFFTYFCYY